MVFLAAAGEDVSKARDFLEESFLIKADNYKEAEKKLQARLDEMWKSHIFIVHQADYTKPVEYAVLMGEIDNPFRNGKSVVQIDEDVAGLIEDAYMEVGS